MLSLPSTDYCIHTHIYVHSYLLFFSWFMSIPQSNVLSMSLNMGDDFLKSKSLPREYAELTVPNYGVEVPQGMDFSKYNQKRVCESEHVSVQTLCSVGMKAMVDVCVCSCSLDVLHALWWRCGTPLLSLHVV